MRSRRARRGPTIVLLLALAGTLLPLPAGASDSEGLRDLGSEPVSKIEYQPSPDENSFDVYGGDFVSNPGWIAALFNDGEFTCTGSLVDPVVVLTAAHCVDSPGSFTVRIGSDYLYGEGVSRFVTDVYIHPDWGGLFNDTDLALLSLDAPVTSLPVATLNTNPAWPEFSQVLVVAGWGSFYDGSPASLDLRAGAVFATSGMNGDYDPLWCDLPASARVPGGLFCFGGPLVDEVSSCSGDSGGPVAGSSSPSLDDDELVVYGVVSYGPDYCGWNYYDDKAQSVGSHAGWISSTIDFINAPLAIGTDSVVLYAPSSSRVFIRDVRLNGTGFSSPAHSGPVLDTDTIGMAYLGGPVDSVDDILFYSSTTGRFQFASVSAPDAGGRRYLDVFVDVTGTRGWTHVVAGDYNGDGQGDVLFYRSTDGLLRFYTTSASGEFTPLTPAYFGTTGWTHLVVGDFNSDGSDDVMWYRSRDGLLRFYEVSPSGEFRGLTPAYFGTTNWTSIPSGDFDGNGTDDVLFYRDDGLARFYEVDAGGTFRALGAAFRPSPGFDQIESAELTPSDANVDLVWYHNGFATLLATRFATDNVVNLWPSQSTSDIGTDLFLATGRLRR